MISALHLGRQPRWRVSAWVLIAMVVMALAPAVSRLQAAADPLAWVPVCTGAGLVQAMSQPDGQPMPNPAEQARWGAGLAPPIHADALPSAEVTLALPIQGGAEPPRVSPRWLAPSPTWPRAQARAPPTA